MIERKPLAKIDTPDLRLRLQLSLWWLASYGRPRLKIDRN